MTDATGRIELLATDGSMYDVEIVESDIVDRIECDVRDDTIFCEMEVGGEYSVVRRSEFDEVRMDGFERHTTINPQDGNDIYMDSFLGYCGVVDVEDTGGITDDKRMLVCVDSDRL